MALKKKAKTGAKQPEYGELSDDQKIIALAQKRFERCITWESTFRQRFVADLKFANADPDNHWQWPDDMFNARTLEKRPSLTINKTRQHNLMIINDAKQNKPGVKISPTGNGSSYDAAKIYMGIVRHIEYKSSAEHIYDLATKFQVEGGVGYFRLITDYISDDSFDQEILIKGIDDPMSVYLDPDIKTPDGSDARFGFLFEDMPKEEFEREYPNYKDIAGGEALGSGIQSWTTEDHVRVAEYYCKEQEDDELISFEVGNGKRQTARASELDKALVDHYKAQESTKTRELTVDRVRWYKIVGHKIVDRRDWLGKFVPIIRIIGEETKINGQLDRKGHTRSMKDAQRMYNYWTSAGVEFIALQGKAPWLVVPEAIMGFEDKWQTSAIINHPYLVYNHRDEDGVELPIPTRPAPPVASSAYTQGMQIAQNEMMMATGQYQAQMGENENAKSGVAIGARQRQGERATYHYIDGLGIGISYLGKQLIDLIPKVMDTERILMIIGEDGKESQIKIDPEAKQALQETGANQKEGEASIIFNPSVGDYAVQSDVGPSFATRRQEAFNAFTQIATQSPTFMNIAGDIMFKAADFPMADELAERYRRMVPQQALGEAPPPEIQQMLAAGEQKVQSMSALLTNMTEALAKKDKELANREADIAIRRYQSRTQRLQTVVAAQPALGETILPIAVKTEEEILKDGGSASMGDAFTPEMDQGVMVQMMPSLIAALQSISEANQRTLQAVMAPRINELKMGPDGRPAGSISRIDMSGNR